MNLALEGPLERQICADPVWREGAAWGKPRSGHPEGAVIHHIAHVLANIDALNVPAQMRFDLRLIALVHDTLKYQVVRRDKNRNDHGLLARQFAESYLTGRADLLEVIELHDEAYRAWRTARERDAWHAGEARVRALLARLDRTGSVELYVAFYSADNATEGKGRESYEWFERLAHEHIARTA